MIKVNYTELDGPYGPAMRLEAAGHAGYAPAGQDIVCAGVSTLMQALVSLLAGEENAHSDAFDEPDGPRLTGGEITVVALVQRDAHLGGSLHLELIKSLLGFGNECLIACHNCESPFCVFALGNIARRDLYSSSPQSESRSPPRCRRLRASFVLALVLL